MPQYGWHRYTQLIQDRVQPTFMDLLWYDGKGLDYEPGGLPRNRYFRGAECVSMRSAWDDPNALVVAFNAGANYNLLAHRHLDQGSFMIEAEGERWAMDMGSDRQTYNQHLHDYPKWYFYRLRAEGHNTLVFNPDSGRDQEPDAEARIINYESADNLTTATADLSAAYARHARSVHRTLSLVDNEYVTITDVIEAEQSAEVWWFMHTEAAIDLERSDTATRLSRNGKAFRAEILEPEGAVFSFTDATPLPTSPNPDKQEGNEGCRKLVIHLSDVIRMSLTVRLGPDT